ncbi:hypothetical protein [Aeromonas hydrophila]|uniref:hypothetical protein n=1 Tax=Aeromonas hydrophila TaxID=644 RepID=UPI00191E94AF|nr:hypothetical protein [Aeromonas hydrophila]MBL0561627.1 hypothetical protein [Aeromonas hydrophila]
MVVAILGASIELSLCLPTEPAELVPVFTVLQVLKVLDLSLDIVLSLERGAGVVASRCLLQRPGIGMVLPAESESASTATTEGGAKTPSKGGYANPSAGHGQTRWVMSDALYAAAPLRKISRRADWRSSAASRGAADIKVLSRCSMTYQSVACF